MHSFVHHFNVAAAKGEGHFNYFLFLHHNVFVDIYIFFLSSSELYWVTVLSFFPPLYICIVVFILLLKSDFIIHLSTKADTNEYLITQKIVKNAKNHIVFSQPLIIPSIKCHMYTDVIDVSVLFMCVLMWGVFLGACPEFWTCHGCKDVVLTSDWQILTDTCTYRTGHAHSMHRNLLLYCISVASEPDSCILASHWYQRCLAWPPRGCKDLIGWGVNLHIRSEQVWTRLEDKGNTFLSSFAFPFHISHFVFQSVK